MNSGAPSRLRGWLSTTWLLPLVSHQKKLRPRRTFEFRRAEAVTQSVADAESVAAQFVNRGNFLAGVRAFGAGDVQRLGLERGVDGIGPFVRNTPDGDFVFAIVQFQDCGLQEIVRHGLAADLRLDRQPSAL